MSEHCAKCGTESNVYRVEFNQGEMPLCGQCYSVIAHNDEHAKRRLLKVLIGVIVLVACIVLYVSACASGGPRLADYDCSEERFCHAGVIDDERGVAIVTDAPNDCARVHVDNVGPMLVCGGRHPMGSAKSVGTSECRICRSRATP